MSNDASVYLKSPFDMMNIKYENVEFPRSTMNKIANEIVPNHKLTNDGRELIANCCKEFIQLISSRASQLCSVQNKTYLTREHVLMALKDLGFSSICSDLEEFAETSKKKRKRKGRLSDLDIPEEELFRQQQELLNEARTEWNKKMSLESLKLNAAVRSDNELNT